MYYTYAIGRKKHRVVYLLSEIHTQRVWSTNPEDAMVFFTPEEVKYVIKLFKIPDGRIARIQHKT